MEKLLTPQEVAKILSVKRVTVYRMLREGRLSGVKISPRKWLIRETALLSLLQEGARGG